MVASYSSRCGKFPFTDGFLLKKFRIGNSSCQYSFQSWVSVLESFSTPTPVSGVDHVNKLFNYPWLFVLDSWKLYWTDQLIEITINSHSFWCYSSVYCRKEKRLWWNFWRRWSNYHWLKWRRSRLWLNSTNWNERWQRRTTLISEMCWHGLHDLGCSKHTGSEGEG